METPVFGYFLICWLKVFWEKSFCLQLKTVVVFLITYLMCIQWGHIFFFYFFYCLLALQQLNACILINMYLVWMPVSRIWFLKLNNLCTVVKNLSLLILKQYSIFWRHGQKKENINMQTSRKSTEAWQNVVNNLGDISSVVACNVFLCIVNIVGW